MGRSSLLLIASVLLGAVHCSGSEPDPNPGDSSGGNASTGGRAGSGGTSATGGAGETPGGPLEVNDCGADDYEDRSAEDDDRTILIAAEGLVYTPRCITIAKGQTVHWQGRFAAHPMSPGTPEDGEAGSPGTPIVRTASGNAKDFTFEDAGTFPYFCEIHAGMAGSIYVRE